MKIKSILRSRLVFAASSLLAVSSAYAAPDEDGTWTLNNNGNWSTTTNWSGGTVADGVGFSAYLSNVINNNRNITLDTVRTIGNIYAQDTSHNYSIIGVNMLTLDASSGQSILDVVSGRTLTISAPVTINDGIQKTGAGALTVSGATTLGSSQTWQVNAGTATFNGIIDDGGNAYGITKTGIERLDLGSVNHTFSGGLTINAGEVQFRANDNGSTSTTLGAGNITINGGVAAAYWGYTFSRSLGTGADQVQITGGVSGFGGNGATGGTFSLNTGVGNPAISWGDPAFNPSEFVLQSSGANTNGKSTFTNHIDLNGDGGTPDGNGIVWRTIRSDQTGYNFDGYGIFSGNIINSGTTNMGGLIKTGIGQHILSGTNTYDGGTQVNEGTLTVTAPGALPGYDTSGKVTVAGGAILAVRNSGWSAANIDDLRANATWSANTSTLGFDTSGTFTYTSDITEALSIAQIGTGTLVLGGNNSYTGATTLYRGTLRADSATALGNGGDITFLGGTLQYTANSAGTDFGSRITNSTSAMLINTNGQDVTLSNLGSGNTGGLTKSGAGTLTFSGTNTYSGATTLSAGTIAVYNGTLNTSGAAVSLASNTSVSVLGGSVNSTWNLGTQDLQQSGSDVTNVQVTIDGDGVEGSAVVTNVRNLIWGRTLTNSTLTLTDGGQMNVTGEVRIGNPYYSLLGGANITIGGGTATSTFSGDGGDDFYIGYGERRNSNNNVVTVGNNGVLTNIRDMFVGHVNNAQNASAVNPSTANQLTVTGTGTASMRGISVGYAQNAGIVTQLADANANVVEVTSGGTLSTTGTSHVGRANNNYTASNANTLTVTGTGSSWNAGNQNVFVGFTTSNTAQSNNNILTVGAGATVTNVAALTVGSGSGTETGNQLVVNGSLTATSVSISANNNLAGSGTVNGPVTVNGTLSPGNSIGTITVGNLTFGSTGTYSVELDAGLATGDQTSVTGTVAIDAATALSLNVTGTLLAGQKFFIVANDDVDAVTGTFAGLTQDAVVGTYGGVDLKISYTGDSGTSALTGGNDIVLYAEGGGGTPYETWAGPGVPFDGDANGDGVSNGLAFLLGAVDPDVSALDKLPTVTESAGGLVLTFDMLDAASRGGAQLHVEHSNDIGLNDDWVSVLVPDATPDPQASDVTFTVSGSGTLDVTATIQSTEAGGTGKLFGRLKAVNP